ncbi:MAG TPA: zf-HC2 domain-containing protein [Longimicrobiales bacterium]|nr:zf-HC2 domain-containing protein [Longimicrobiales bacterium]
MTDPRCESVGDAIPDFAAGRLDAARGAAVQSHLDVCGECRAEAELVGLLYAARPELPADLVQSIEGGMRFRRRAATRPWWGIAAAAVAAVALGIGVSSRSNPVMEDVPAYVAEMQGLSPWVSDDALIAGAPVLDDLSEEALQILLDEMGAGGPGGAA